MEMTPWQRWAERPQSVWVRKALFQVHLWTGIGIGLYVLVISISGSAIVFRRELIRKYPRKEITVAESGRRLETHEVERNIQRAYPNYEVLSVREPERRDLPDEVILQNRKRESGGCSILTPEQTSAILNPASIWFSGGWSICMTICLRDSRAALQTALAVFWSPYLG